MKSEIKLSIQPTFLCNYNCDYCYLGDLRKDRTVLDLNILKNRLEEITDRYNITYIQVLGGEISLLDEEYIDELYNLIKNYNVSFTTNLSNMWIVNFCLLHNIKLGVSLNEERPYYNETVEKLKKIKHIKNITLSSVVLPSLLNKSPKEVLDFYNELGFTVYFIQYEKSKLSKINYDISLKEYIDFMNSIYNEYQSNDYNFSLGNEINMNLENIDISYDKCLFINPNGNYGSIISDGLKEYIKEFKTLEEFISFFISYREQQNKECSECRFYEKCKRKYKLSSNSIKCSELYNIFNGCKDEK